MSLKATAQKLKVWVLKQHHCNIISHNVPLYLGLGHFRIDVTHVRTFLRLTYLQAMSRLQTRITALRTCRIANVVALISSVSRHLIKGAIMCVNFAYALTFFCSLVGICDEVKCLKCSCLVIYKYMKHKTRITIDVDCR